MFNDYFQAEHLQGFCLNICFKLHTNADVWKNNVLNTALIPTNNAKFGFLKKNVKTLISDFFSDRNSMDEKTRTF